MPGQLQLARAIPSQPESPVGPEQEEPVERGEAREEEEGVKGGEVYSCGEEAPPPRLCY